MKRYFPILLWAFLLLPSGNAQAQVRFDADFEGGSLGTVQLLDSTRFIVAPGDTVTQLSFLVTGRFDPDNPIDTWRPAPTGTISG